MPIFNPKQLKEKYIFKATTFFRKSISTNPYQSTSTVAPKYTKANKQHQPKTNAT
jgi:hypothetical protein